jgi:TonB family protein
VRLEINVRLKIGVMLKISVMLISVSRFLLAIVLACSFAEFAVAQSGAQNTRANWREYGVNLNYAIYQYDAQRSPALEELTRLSGTYSTADDEIAYLKEKHKLEEVAVRHVRSVGLRSDETFNDAVLLGPEYMVAVVTPREIARGHMKLDIKMRYGNNALLDMKGIEFESYETAMLRGGKGMFGVKYYVGAGGRQESAPIERTLLVSVTPEIVPSSSLRNRPEQLSRPVDEYGGAVQMKESDRFTPPVALERVAPKFESTRSVRGSVLVGGVVTPEGNIINVRALRSLDPVIDERAVEAFRQYKFSPALLNGKPVYATYREEISFAAPPPSILEIEDQQRKQREAEKEKDKQRQKRRWP